MFDKEFLKEVLGVQSYSGDYKRMIDFLKVTLNKIDGVNYSVDKHDNIYVTKGDGDLYPCVVAHTDTVHKLIKKFHVVEAAGSIFGWDENKMRMSGIGGDDKVGIYLALSCLMYFDNIKVVFFADEEIGCVGSGKADLTFFKDCTLVLQGDRRGNDEFISNSNSCDLFGDEFTEVVSPILKAHQYKLGTGTITDVGQLKQDGLDIACANVACGYYNAHSADEVVNINDVEDCLMLFIDIIDQLGFEKRWEHVYEYVPYVSSYKWGKSYYNYRTHGGYGTALKKTESTLKREEAVRKLDLGIIFSAVCPNCKTVHDFYEGVDEDYMCDTCYGGVSLFDIQILDDYEKMAGSYDYDYDAWVDGDTYDEEDDEEDDEKDFPKFKEAVNTITGSYKEEMGLLKKQMTSREPDDYWIR